MGLFEGCFSSTVFLLSNYST